MKNNKGFMLAEVVVTSTIVLTILISLYASFNRLYKNFEQRSKYFDIDGVYAIKAIMNTIIESGEINTLIKNTSTTTTTIINNGTCQITTSSCSSITTTYDIKNMYIVNKNNLSQLKSSVTNNTFKDYIDYMGKYYKISDNTYSYFIITEYKNNDDYYYSSLKLG